MKREATIDHQGSRTLQAAIAGEVLLPGDLGYDEARRSWNLAVDQRPALVVMASSSADVVEAVRFAASQGMRIAPQSTGHGSLPLERLDDAMLLKTSSMRSVDVDPTARRARVGAGAVWQDVAVPADAHGLAALAGAAPNVGVTGYILGGGLGWLARRYGLAANSVTSAEIVTPDGRLARADAHHEPELLWAIKGGGGSVGVVTALEMTLYPVPELYAGALFFPVSRTAEVLHVWRDWTETVPDEVTSSGRVLRIPALPEVPSELRGGAFVLVEAAYIGDATAGAEFIRPLRELGPQLDTFATIGPAALGQINMEPEGPVPVAGNGALLSDLPAAAIDVLVALVGPGADALLATVDLRHLGGALGREAPDAGAQPSVDAQYLVSAAGIAPTTEAGDAVRTRVDGIVRALAPWHAAHGAYNFLDTPAEADVVLPSASYERLRDIKASYDPDQLIISAHPVRPATERK